MVNSAKILTILSFAAFLSILVHPVGLTKKISDKKTDPKLCISRPQRWRPTVTIALTMTGAVTLTLSLTLMTDDIFATLTH